MADGPSNSSIDARLAVGTVAGGGGSRAALVESLKLHVPSRTAWLDSRKESAIAAVATYHCPTFFFFLFSWVKFMNLTIIALSFLFGN